MEEEVSSPSQSVNIATMQMTWKQAASLKINAAGQNTATGLQLEVEYLA